MLYSSAGELTALPQIPSWIYRAIRGERKSVEREGTEGKEKKARDGRSGRNSPEINLWLRPC